MATNILSLQRAAAQNVVGYTNEDWLGGIAFFGPDGVTPVSVAGISFEMTVRRKAADPERLIYASTDNGLLIAGGNAVGYRIPVELTAALEPRDYVFDLRASDPDFTVDIIVPSTITVSGRLAMIIGSLSPLYPLGGAVRVAGPPGRDGNTLRQGRGQPAEALGQDGDYYIDRSTQHLYGPKTDGHWSSLYTALIGPAGPRGFSLLHGTTVPSPLLGRVDDFYLRVTTSTLYGPKTPAGWPASGTALVGPTGLSILSGTAAPTGSTGRDGESYLRRGQPQGPLLYGPRVNGEWGAPITLQGTQGLTPIGPWAPGVAYTVGPPASCVSRGGSSYQCLISHTSSGNFEADLAAERWGYVALRGADTGLRYEWAVPTSGDPGVGKVLANAATFSAISEINLSKVDDDGHDVAALLSSWGTSTNPVKGEFRIVNPLNPATFRVFDVTGISDQGAYRSFAVVPRTSGGALAVHDSVLVQFSRAGDRGIDGDAEAALAAQAAAEDARDEAVDARNVVVAAETQVLSAASAVATDAEAVETARNEVETHAGAIAALYGSAQDIADAVEASAANAATSTTARTDTIAARDDAQEARDEAQAAAAAASSISGLPVFGVHSRRAVLRVKPDLSGLEWSRRVRTHEILAL
jgi:hypothetical protein